MGNHKINITGSKIYKHRRKARTDEWGILLGENKMSMETPAKRFS